MHDGFPVKQVSVIKQVGKQQVVADRGLGRLSGGDPVLNSALTGWLTVGLKPAWANGRRPNYKKNKKQKPPALLF